MLPTRKGVVDSELRNATQIQYTQDFFSCECRQACRAIDPKLLAKNATQLPRTPHEITPTAQPAQPMRGPIVNPRIVPPRIVPNAAPPRTNHSSQVQTCPCSDRGDGGGKADFTASENGRFALGTSSLNAGFAARHSTTSCDVSRKRLPMSVPKTWAATNTADAPITNGHGPSVSAISVINTHSSVTKKNIWRRRNRSRWGSRGGEDIVVIIVGIGLVDKHSECG